ncbi:MAG: flagellar hook-basal body complex protein [Methylomarinum sp.]|nr:flagellar hook-basal body complex protein [Methylomarinum sp.]
MGFSTALSGLNAASKSLQVLGNNIANANTTGFKESRTEFADVYNNTTIASVSKVAAGAGVSVSEVAQQFHQGNVESTQNNLDLAISGNGFFALGDNIDATNVSAYTRNGAFHLNPEGYITNDSGHFLMGGAPVGDNVVDGFDTGVPQALRIDTSQGKPSATTDIDLIVNLDSRDDVPVNPFVGFDPALNAGPDVDSYNSATSVTLFDSLGNTHTLTTYFVKEQASAVAPVVDPNTWSAYLFLDGRGVNTGATATLDDPTVAVPVAADLVGTKIPMVFDSLGNMVAASTGTDTTAGSLDDFVITGLDISALDPSIKVDPLSFSLNPTASTQYASNFDVNELQQDGFGAGNLTGVSIDSDGIVVARFSNGTANPLGQVILGRFINNQGLSKIGDTTWQESTSSGGAVLGVAGGNNFGTISSASLENSNTDIASQLVKLIVAQQAYQANAKTISTEDEIIQTILNI